MSESLDGVSFSVTRQNAGSVLNAAAAFALVALGGVKAPGATGSADSTRPFVTCVCASDSHAIGAGAAAFNVSSVTAASSAIPGAILMRGSVVQASRYTIAPDSQIQGDEPMRGLLRVLVSLLVLSLVAIPTVAQDAGAFDGIMQSYVQNQTFMGSVLVA